MSVHTIDWYNEDRRRWEARLREILAATSLDTKYLDMDGVVDHGKPRQ